MLPLSLTPILRPPSRNGCRQCPGPVAFGVGRQVLRQRRVRFPALAKDQLVEKQDRSEAGAPDNIAGVRAKGGQKMRDHGPLPRQEIFSGRRLENALGRGRETFRMGDCVYNSPKTRMGVSICHGFPHIAALIRAYLLCENHGVSAWRHRPFK